MVLFCLINHIALAGQNHLILQGSVSIIYEIEYGTLKKLNIGREDKNPADQTKLPDKYLMRLTLFNIILNIIVIV